MISSKGSSLTFGLAQQLGRQIVSGQYPPGATLPNEAQISSELSVGRTAVREAVKMLSAKGLVETRPRRGTQILPYRDWNYFDRDVLSWLREEDPDPATIVELLQLRLGVEPQAAELAATQATNEEIAAIGNGLERMRIAGEGRTDPVAADAVFHESIIAATHNRFFQPFGALVRTALSITAPTTNMIFGHSVGDLEAHKGVFDSIAARDPAEAHRRMRAMLQEVCDKVAAWHGGKRVSGEFKAGRH
ncbi:MAG: FadR/GntR family transcriptional regulator [Novosphingobium sp.]